MVKFSAVLKCWSNVNILSIKERYNIKSSRVTHSAVHQYAKFESHQCLHICRYMYLTGSVVMLTAKRLVSVTPDVNLGKLLDTSNKACKQGNHLKLMSSENQKLSEALQKGATFFVKERTGILAIYA